MNYVLAMRAHARLERRAFFAFFNVGKQGFAGKGGTLIATRNRDETSQFIALSVRRMASRSGCRKSLTSHNISLQVSRASSCTAAPSPIDQQLETFRE
jgi:hypothetical protein